jgi:hypothetical protein
MDTAKRRLEVTDLHSDIKNKEGQDLETMINAMTSLSGEMPAPGEAPQE